jgi:hypothetical protein
MYLYHLKYLAKVTQAAGLIKFGTSAVQENEHFITI